MSGYRNPILHFYKKRIEIKLHFATLKFMAKKKL